MEHGETSENCCVDAGCPTDQSCQNNKCIELKPRGGGTDWDQAYVFADPKGDFWLGPDSPPQVIQFTPVDIINVYVTNDNDYLYLKVEMDGTLPTLPMTYADNNVHQIGWTVVIDNDQNTATGRMGGYYGSDITLDLIHLQENGSERWCGHYMFYDPAGYEGCGPSHFVSDAKTGGGEGENYVTWKLPLPELGLQKGVKINLAVWAEAESNLYHHFARDEAPTQGQWYTNIEIR